MRRFGVLAFLLLAFSPAAAAGPTFAAKEVQVRHFAIVVTGATHTEQIDSGNAPHTDGQLTEDLTWTARFNHVSLKVTSSTFGDAISLNGARATFTSHFTFKDSYEFDGPTCSGSVNNQLPGKAVLLGTAFVKSPNSRFLHFSAQLDGFEGIAPDVDAATRSACRGHTLAEPRWVTGDKKLAGGLIAREPTPYILSTNFDGHKTNSVRDIIHALARGHALILNSGAVAGTVSRSCPSTCTNSVHATLKVRFIPG